MSCKGVTGSGACQSTVVLTIASRKGEYELCQWHAERHCDACGKIGIEIHPVVSTSPNGRAFRLCLECARKKMLAPALATPATPKLIANRREHPQYEVGFARLAMMLPAVCRIEGNVESKIVNKKTVQAAARWWEIACPTVAPYDAVANLLDEHSARRNAPTLMPAMGVVERTPLSGGFASSEYGYWTLGPHNIPEPKSAWWQKLAAAIPGTSVGTIAYEPPVATEPKPTKRSRRRAA